MDFIREMHIKLFNDNLYCQLERWNNFHTKKKRNKKYAYIFSVLMRLLNCFFHKHGIYIPYLANL